MLRAIRVRDSSDWRQARSTSSIDLRPARGYLAAERSASEGFAAAPGWSPAESERRVAEAGAQGLVVPLGAVIPTPDLLPCQVLDPANPTPVLPMGG